MTDQEFNLKSLAYHFNKAMSKVTILSKFICVTFPLFLEKDLENPREYVNELLSELYPNKNYTMIYGYLNLTADGITRCSCFISNNDDNIIDLKRTLVNLARCQFIGGVTDDIKQGKIIYSQKYGVLNVENIGIRLTWSIQTLKNDLGSKYNNLLKYINEENKKIIEYGLEYKLHVEDKDENLSTIKISVDNISDDNISVDKI